MTTDPPLGTSSVRRRRVFAACGRAAWRALGTGLAALLVAIALAPLACSNAPAATGNAPAGGAPVLAGLARARLITPDGVLDRFAWTEAERALAASADGPALRALLFTSEGSYAVGLVGRADRPHVNETDDMVLVCLSGGFTFHFGDRRYLVGPGDVIFVPVGTEHYVGALTDPAAGAEVFITAGGPPEGDASQYTTTPTDNAPADNAPAAGNAPTDNTPADNAPADNG